MVIPSNIYYMQNIHIIAADRPASVERRLSLRKKGFNEIFGRAGD